jgi:hypothetical protein
VLRRLQHFWSVIREPWKASPEHKAVERLASEQERRVEALRRRRLQVQLDAMRHARD